MRNVLTIMVLLLAACPPRAARPVASSPPPIDVGTVAEVHTAAGPLDGVEVVRPCVYAALGLVAHGARQPPSLREPDAYNRWANALRARIVALGPPVVGVGWGQGCREGEAGPIVFVSHHREIDGVVPRLVQLLRDEDLSLKVAVSVPQVTATELALTR